MIMPVRAAFRNPWWVVFGATLGLIVSNGPILEFTFGVLLKPVTSEFGWNRGTMASAIIISHIVGAVATPFVGKMIDRWGIRLVTLPFICMFALTTAAISRTPRSPVAFFMLYAVCGLFSSGQAPQAYVKAVSAWFDSKRGLALGIATAGIGLGAALMPQVTRLLINKFGWRDAYVGLGIMTFCLAFPAVALFVREPENYLKSSAAVPGDTRLPGVTVKEAMKGSFKFWIIAVTGLIVATTVNGTIAHIVPLLTDRGVPNRLATFVLTVSGLALIGGRLLGGYLLDRFFAPYVAAFFFLLPFVGVSLLGSGLAGIVPLAGALCLGLGLGSETALIAFLAGRYFGMKHYGEIYGYLFAIFLFGAGLGPWLMGVCFDVSGSYNDALVGFGLALLVASFLISRLGPYTYPVSDESGIILASESSVPAKMS
jgi:MFS family permease